MKTCTSTASRSHPRKLVRTANRACVFTDLAVQGNESYKKFKAPRVHTYRLCWPFEYHPHFCGFGDAMAMFGPFLVLLMLNYYDFQISFRIQNTGICTQESRVGNGQGRFEVDPPDVCARISQLCSQALGYASGTAHGYSQRTVPTLRRQK